MQKGGKMYPANSEVTIYQEEQKTKTTKFKDVVTGEEKTLEIPYTVSTEHKEILPVPYASFRDAGQHRNGVKVWHEYEYNWSLFKAMDKK
jgi:hypothetical protein